VLQRAGDVVVQTIKSAIAGQRKAGVPLNSVTVRCLILAILTASAAFVVSGGMGFTASNSWVRKFMRDEIGMSFRRHTTAAQKLPADHEQQCHLSRQRVAFLAKAFSIPASRIINFDQTGVHYVPMQGQRTYELVGAKDISITGTEDKRAFTVVVASTLAGDVPPLQMVFGGTTANSLPTRLVTAGLTEAGHHITHSHNHWSTQQTMHDYIKSVIVPYITGQPADSVIGSQVPHAVLLLDCWSVHKSQEFLTYMAENWPTLHLVFVPGGTTGVFQPADVALNRPFKHFIKQQFSLWMQSEVSDALAKGTLPENIKVNLGIKAGLRDFTAQWTHGAWEHLVSHPDWVVKG
jgi:hypothetical protein